MIWSRGAGAARWWLCVALLARTNAGPAAAKRRIVHLSADRWAIRLGGGRVEDRAVDAARMERRWRGSAEGNGAVACAVIGVFGPRGHGVPTVM